MTRAIRTFFCIVLCLLPATTFAATDLYGKIGVAPQAVRQGLLGSCYFHASIASLASVRPELLRDAIRQDAKGNLSVRFADGKLENVYLDDVNYARSSGYDVSDGLWVAVLFRGYAQRTLRTAMLGAITKTSLSASLKLATSGVVSNSDLLMLAYDRAIRMQIDQYGNIDRDRLKARLRQELKSVPIDERWRERALELLESSGYFESLAEQVKTNGELFGAYRAVGQGGLPQRVIQAFAGSGSSYRVGSTQATAAAIAAALRQHQPVVAWTGTAATQPTIDKWRSIVRGETTNWYVSGHAYSVLAINTGAGTVTIRNPWGNHPDPGGEFTLSWDSFASAYAGFSTSTEAQADFSRQRE